MYRDRKEEDFRRAGKALDTCFKNVGPPVSPDRAEVIKRLKEYDQIPMGSSFHFLFDVRPNNRRIKWESKHISYVFGYENLTYSQWLSIIHPDFLRIYLEFGIAAYRLSLEYQKALIEEHTSYSINLPAKSGKDGQYRMLNQVSYPFEFDKDGQMVSHLNTYKVIGHFEEYTPSRPMVSFGGNTHKEVEKEVLKATQELVLSTFFPDLKSRHVKTLNTYWDFYSEPGGKMKDQLASRRVAEALKLKTSVIQDHNKEIKEHANVAFPISDFTDIRSVVKFLYKLFGPTDR